MHAETLRRRVEPEPAPEAPPEAAEARRVESRPIVVPEVCPGGRKRQRLESQDGVARGELRTEGIDTL